MHYVHALHDVVKGRARFKVRGLHRSERFSVYLTEQLTGHDAVFSVSPNPLTGNILVHFDSLQTARAIAVLIESVVESYPNGGSKGRNPISDRTCPSRPVKEQGGALAQQIRTPSIIPDRWKKLLVQQQVQRTEPWHLMEAESVVGVLESSRETGLSETDVEERLRKYGRNLLPEAVARSALSIFLDQFKSLPVLLLGAAAILSVITGGAIDALVIVGVVAINGAIGYATESEAERTIHSLKSLVRPHASVIRDGEQRDIVAAEVTPGDIVVLRPGAYVPADCRLLEAVQMSVDESALTGESMPAVKSAEPLLRRDIPLADRSNMVYMGTLVTGGQGRAVVVATGRFTEVGRLQALVGSAQSPDTPMERQLDQLGNQLVLISAAACGLVLCIGLLRGYGLLMMIKTAISLAVAAVPEGLPSVATTTLAIGIRNMKQRQVLIRHLEAVETLGAVQTICFDKTGTITANQMSVLRIYAGMHRFDVRDGRIVSGNGSGDPADRPELIKLIEMCVLCNETDVTREHGEFTLRGSPTEAALIDLAIQSAVDVIGLREHYPLLKINYRSENRLFMGTFHETAETDRLLAIKGSPAEVLAMCEWHIRDGQTVPLSEEERIRIELENESMAGDALRVLGVAYARGYLDGDIVEESDFLWLGLVGMADPVRSGVKDLIAEFHRAGIDTVMITGDQGTTAYAVGRELNLSRGEQLEILDSTHLAELEPEVLSALAQRVQVFARVSPSHKLQIVQALQKAGKVVAMTGDGINDGPALKAADIGIAMGGAGTDVAREIADVVLAEDNLETMIIAVRDGRAIYANIRKSLHFLLSTNFSEILVMFLSIAAGTGSPLNAIQLLWLNLISDIFPGLALALEPADPHVLERPPRPPTEPIVKAEDFKRLGFESAALSSGAMAAYGYGLTRYGAGPAAGTLAFQSLTMGQLLHAISCRSEQRVLFGGEKLAPSPYLTAALGGSFLLQLLTIFIPGLRTMLGITPIGILDGLVIGATALLPLAVNEATKKPIQKHEMMKTRTTL